MRTPREAVLHWYQNARKGLLGVSPQAFALDPERMKRKKLAPKTKKGYSPDVHWAPEQPEQQPTREDMGLPVPKLAPFGWELRGSVLEPVAEEQMALRQIRLHFAFGASAKEIAKTLNQDGLLPDGQTSWSEQAVEELLSYNDEPLWQEWLAREMGEE